MAIPEKREGDVVILSPQGDFLGGNETDELERRLWELAECGNRSLVLNCSGMDLVTSPVLRMLERIANNYRLRGGQVRLCQVKGRSAVKLSALPSGEVYHTEEQAICAG